MASIDRVGPARRVRSINVSSRLAVFKKKKRKERKTDREMKRGHEKEFVCLRRDGSCQSVPSLVHLRSPCMSLLLGLFLLSSQDSVTQDYVHRATQHRVAAIK